MIDSLKIRGFKLFRNLEMPKLARLNLFVGANNTGKSCLLEAVRLYLILASGDVSVIRDLIRSRDGDWEVNIVSKREAELESWAANVENPIRYLFRDFHYAKDPNAKIEIEASGKNEFNVAVSSAFFQVVRDDDTSPANFISVSRDKALEIPDAEEYLEVSIDKSVRRVSMSRFSESYWSRRRFPFPPIHLLNAPSIPRPTVVVSTSGIVLDDVASLWDKAASLAAQQEKVLQALRLIERKIELLVFVGDSARNGQRIPMVRVQGSEELYPLKSMGDGLTRLFHIALAIVNARNGVVLIDEFENGLYWGVLERLWPSIFQLAEDLNVQVFATTHSQDCISSFATAWGERPEAGTMYRLEREADESKAVLLPLVNTRDAIAANVEVR